MNLHLYTLTKYILLEQINRAYMAGIQLIFIFKAIFILNTVLRCHELISGSH